MALGDWNQRLSEHFSALARSRRDIPLFALEHGLAPAEVIALSHELRAYILVSPPSPEHPLVWTTYAAEIGYGYSGDEYWQTFEECTPGWTLNGTRGWIRDAFIYFQEQFSGARPSGPWADQFSIIAWPITHAILARDLQQQLARTLYDLRHTFSAELFEEPRRLGEFIAARSWHSSARFRNLVQAPALVGQIAAALLLQGKRGFMTLIHPMTLKRIGDDVDRERGGRDWLRSARRAAEERGRIRGLTIGRPTTAAFQRRDEARAEVERLGIEPRLVLRPIESARWEVSLEIPDLSHLLLRFPQTREVLTESRCAVAGAAGRPLARGRCLNGPQRVALSRWPRADEVLLTFDRTNPQLEYLLRAECMLRPGPSWLFRIASDGQAYESRGMLVRADTRYLIVSTEPFDRSPLAHDVEVTCEGVHALLLEVPSALTQEWEQALRQLQVTQAKSIEVWPAGLAAVAWDGEGHGEWLASETPTLAIRSDHAIDVLTIGMGDGPSLSLTLNDTPPGEPIFIGLPLLPAGLHKLSVAARTGKGPDSEVVGDLDVVMRVRNASTWMPGETTNGPLEVEMYPPAPTIEQLWEGEVDIEVRGPRGRNIKCDLALYEDRGTGPTLVEKLPPMPLPLLAGQWKAHFERYGRGSKRVQEAYDRSRVCRVELVADELGGFTFECEREFVPLRWALRQNGTEVRARLIDDSGEAELPKVELIRFDAPTTAVRLSLLSEYPVSSAGGLFLSRRGNVTAALIAVPTTMRNLAELGVSPQITPRTRSLGAVVDGLEYARLWATARSSGNTIVAIKRRRVLQALCCHIVSLLGGEQWARAERAVTSGGDADLTGLERAVSSRSDQAGMAAAIGHDIATLATAELRARVERLADLAVKYRVLAYDAPEEGEEARWLAELSLRVASSPGDAAVWAGPHLRGAINKLFVEVPVLARAARFMVVAVDRKLQSRTAPGEVFASWGWG